MRVSYTAANADAAERIFGELAKDGDVEVPLAPTSWSPAFGMCTDRFGIPWMVGTNPAE